MSALLLTASKRRSWWYVQPPAAFDCACDQCGGANLAWSEFRGLVWCYDCQIDTAGNGGIFRGPIPVTLCAMLGITFNIWHDRLKRVLYFHPNTNQYWRFPAEGRDRT